MPSKAAHAVVWISVQVMDPPAEVSSKRGSAEESAKKQPLESELSVPMPTLYTAPSDAV